MVEPNYRAQTTIWRMHIACWIPKATNIHSEYETVTAILLQRWLRRPSLMLPYTYILPVLLIFSTFKCIYDLRCTEAKSF